MFGEDGPTEEMVEEVLAEVDPRSPEQVKAAYVENE